MNIIVTGAGKGIGFELCKKFLQLPDMNVIGISRNTGQLDQLAKINSSLLPFSFDLENDDYSSIINQLSFFPGGKVNILINNAGLLIKKAFIELNTEDNLKMFNINYLAPYRLIQVLLPYFSENSHIVNISSMSGFQGSMKFKGLAGYCASKAALASLTECLATELSDNNIKVNCLCPGGVDTTMFQNAFPESSASVTPEEIACYISEFSLNAHKFMNGKIIPVSFYI